MTTSAWRRWCYALFDARPARPQRLGGLTTLEDRVTPALTPVMLADINPGAAPSDPHEMATIGSTTYFAAFDDVHGEELWKSDDTAAGTTLVKDIWPGTREVSAGYGSVTVLNSSAPGKLTNVNGTLFFMADFEGSRRLWKSDGTEAGTVPAAPVLNVQDFADVGGTLYVSGDSALWTSDGTVAGTTRLGAAVNAQHLTAVNGTLFYTAWDGDHGNELWASDGTEAGTRLVKDAGAGGDLSPSDLTSANGALYFAAADGANGRELWTSDGTTAGTVLVKDLVPGGATSAPWNLTNVGGTLFLTAYSEQGPQRVWASDGTAAGTVVVADIRTSGLWAANGTLYLAADDGVHGEELWTLAGGPAAPPSVRVTGARVAEGNTGAASAQFTVSLSAPSAEPVTVRYGTADGTAAAGSDYQAAGGTLTFAPGETVKTITVPVLGDRLAEPDETFAVNLSGAAGATIADGQGVGTIRDDEPRIRVGDVTRAEGKKGKTTLFTFTVTLSAAYDQPVTVSYRTADGTATAGGADYAPKSGTLTFLSGETTKTVAIQVKGDSKREADEFFYFDLFGNGGNSLISQGRGTGWVLNDD